MLSHIPWAAVVFIIIWGLILLCHKWFDQEPDLAATAICALILTWLLT